MTNGARRGKGTGRVRQLPSGRWQARFPGPDGKLRAAPDTFDTKLDANTWLQAQARDVALERWTPPEAGTAIARPAMTTLSAYADAWLASHDLKPTTRRHYRGLLDRFIVPTLGPIPLDRLTPAQVRTWYADLNSDTPVLRAHTYALLRTLCLSAVDEGLTPTSPCRIRGAGASPRPKHETRPATLDELAKLTAAMPERHQAMVLLAAWCGLRFGEVAELRRTDVRLDAGLVSVSRGVTRVAGQRIVGTPKSDAGRRTVAIPPHLVPVLEQHLKRHTGPGPDALLFPARDGRQLSPSSLYHHLHKARDVAGRPDLRFHDLRHTGATLAAATGATLAELMRRLGHSTPAAALRYQHAAGDRDAAIAEALSAFAADNVVSLAGRRPSTAATGTP